MFSCKELQKGNLTSLIKKAAHPVRQELNDQSCKIDLQGSLSLTDSNISSIKFEELTLQASDDVKDLIVNCSFAGEPCGNLTEVFESDFTEMGSYMLHIQFRKKQTCKVLDQRDRSATGPAYDNNN
jgi:hypothetical protein